jgi:hypothetical protein
MMTEGPPESFDHTHRSRHGCLCCLSTDLQQSTQIVSGFLAARAWGAAPEITALSNCNTCGFRFFNRGLTDAEATRYYRDYRNADYVRERRRWEPFYTNAQHSAQVEWSRSPTRTDALRAVLAQAQTPAHFAAVLDHGGNEGHMLAGISAQRKAVFDPSGCKTLPTIQQYTNAAQLPHDWDLILSCQVLEHVSSPIRYLRSISELLADSGWLYVEVPLETWRSARGTGNLRDRWLHLLLKFRALLIVADVLCTVSRIKLGRLPPFGFIAMREHLNYFSVTALTALLGRGNFHVVVSGINSAGQIFAVARKSNATILGTVGTSSVGS